eukprot:6431666-Prymnesium_polylepis.1
MHLSRPITRQTIPDPHPTYPTPHAHKGQGGARSASALLAAPPAYHLHVARRRRDCQPGRRRHQ